MGSWQTAIPVLPALAAAAAAVGSLAYLNAQWSLNNDWRILTSLTWARIRQARLEKTDRINVFYSLEEFAKSAKTRDLPFLVYEGTTWSFQQTYDTVLGYAAWLQSQGVRSKDIVALDFMNCPQFVFLWLALWSLGAVPAFINYNLTGKPLIHSIRVSTARLLIVDPEIKSALTPEVEAEITSRTFLSSTTNSSSSSSSSSSSKNNNNSSRNSSSNSSSIPKPTSRLKIVHFTSDLQSSLTHQPAYRAPDSARSKTLPRDLAILIYTSGTTGLPKPAICSWNKLHIGGAYVASWMGLRPATSKMPDRFYCSMPLYHSSGSVLGLTNCLMNGTTFVLGHRFSPSKTWKEIRDSDATVLQYVGETCRYLLSAPPEPDPDIPTKNLDQKHKIRIAFGNGLRPDVWDRFKRRFGIATVAEFYAATEGTSGAWNYSSNSFAAGAVGRTGLIVGMLVGKEICIVQLDYESEMPSRDPKTGLCVVLPRGKSGELLCALNPRDIKDTFQGYFGDESASQKKVLRDVVSKGDAWFRTGDVMRWDAEGRWWFVDRIGDTYRWKGENVSTAEVSEVIGLFNSAAAGKAVVMEEVNVYGVKIPGLEMDGRAGCAAMVLRKNDHNHNHNHNQTQKSELSNKEKETLMADLASYLTNSLPKYSVPIFIRLVCQMARTGNMKQQKHVLRGEGVDLEIVEAKHGEEIWWLKMLARHPNGRPGGGDGAGNGQRYVRFTRADLDALKTGKLRL